jgi:phytoene desaturase
VIKRIEKLCDDQILDHIVYKRSYCLNDFKADYNAYKGNAYGLANTLRQTAVFKPGIINKHIANLFYTGQLTVPGPGVPPSLISGKITAVQANKYLTKKTANKRFESTI